MKADAYVKEMKLVGKELVEAIKEEIQFEFIRMGIGDIVIIYSEWERSRPQMKFWISLNEEEYFAHIVEWLKMELPTEFSTFIPFSKNKILFIS